MQVLVRVDQTSELILNPIGVSIIARRFQPRARETGKRLRVNDQVRISPVRLIDDVENQVGVIDLMEAKNMAREAGLDLVEVSPNSSPPVCRIMDYGKWKYQQKKKEQKAKTNSKKSELKEVRLRPAIDEHDLSIKMAKARKFLTQGHKVQYTMMFRGRQNAHKDIGIQLMRDVAAQLDDISKIETPPRGMGRRMTMIIVPDKASDEKVKKPAAKKPASKPAAKPEDKKPEVAAAPAAPPAAPPAPAADKPASEPTSAE
jgi:translation initiation factor IF-3